MALYVRFPSGHAEYLVRPEGTCKSLLSSWDFLIAEGKDGDRKVYHFLIRGAVVEIVV